MLRFRHQSSQQGTSDKLEMDLGLGEKFWQEMAGNWTRNLWLKFKVGGEITHFCENSRWNLENNIAVHVLAIYEINPYLN